MPFSDVVTFTTHKTLRGPRAAASCRPRHLPRAIDKAIFPGQQGGPQEHAIGAKAVAFAEAATAEFRAYGAEIVANAAALAQSLAGHGFRLVSGGTDNHLLLVDLRPFDAELTGKEAQLVLDEAGITLNKNSIPDDPRSPFVTSGIRIGTPAVTTQGMTEGHMHQIGTFVARALSNRADAAEVADVRAEVAELCSTVRSLSGVGVELACEPDVVDDVRTALRRRTSS